MVDRDLDQRTSSQPKTKKKKKQADESHATPAKNIDGRWPCSLL